MRHAVQHVPRIPAQVAGLRRPRHGTDEQLAPARHGSMGLMRGDPSRRSVPSSARRADVSRIMPSRAISGAPSSTSCQLSSAGAPVTSATLPLAPPGRWVALPCGSGTGRMSADPPGRAGGAGRAPGQRVGADLAAGAGGAAVRAGHGRRLAREPVAPPPRPAGVPNCRAHHGVVHRPAGPTAVHQRVVALLDGDCCYLWIRYQHDLVYEPIFSQRFAQAGT